MMELQALLVLCGVGVAGAAVVLLMSLFSATGTSYEEAVAQQRRAATELLALAHTNNKPKKKEKKAIKKQAKKEKRESLAAPSSEAEAESEPPGEEEEARPPAPAPHPRHHVEFSPPVVVELATAAPPQNKIRKRGKESKVKPILINKEDPSCVSDTSLPTPGTDYSNHFEEMHPKDEMELFLHDKAEKKEELVEKKDGKPSKAAKSAKAKPAPLPVEPAKEEPRESTKEETPKEQRKAKKVEKRSVSEDAVDGAREQPPLPQPAELTTDKLLKQVATTATTTTATAGKGKKKKPEPNVLALIASDGGGVNVGELVRVVREAALSRTEIQILTDALLNKHHDPLPQHSEWTEGPNDPMQKLKKQLADKEKALTDEIEASQALHAKLKELRSLLNAERNRAAAATRAGEQAAGAARAELHTLQARLQRLADDNHQLQQDKHVLQSKLGVEAEAQAQRVQMEMHIQRLSESEAGLVQQLNALQAELSARVLEAGQARCEAGAARDGLIMAQQTANELAQQLQEANRMCGELEQQRAMAAHGEQAAASELRAAAERLAETCAEQQRLANRLRQAEASADDRERQRLQLSNEVSSLQQALAERETELAELRALAAAPAATNGLPAAEPGLADQHKAAELAKVESVVQALRDELAAAQRSSSEQRDQLATLHDQLRHYQNKNNELRTKNWKVMEALQTAERALQTKATSAMPAQASLTEAVAKAQEAQYSEVAAILRAACPAAAPGSPASRDWLQTFAENLKKELEKRDQEKKVLEKQTAERPVESDTDAKVNELRAQNEQLQALVDKYKRIIDDTEGVLSRLQSNVTAEEQRWARQLADTQRELDDLKQKTLSQEPLAFAYSCIEKSLPTIVEEMQRKIDSLQEELLKAQGTNHNHTLADAERLAEERMMTASLSSKQSTDISNGPLQVGLDEK